MFWCIEHLLAIFLWNSLYIDLFKIYNIHKPNPEFNLASISLAGQWLVINTPLYIQLGLIFNW